MLNKINENFAFNDLLYTYKHIKKYYSFEKFSILK